jgi:small subunit ribosomal protein S17
MAEETNENPEQTPEEQPAAQAPQATQAPAARSGPTAPPAEVLAPKERRRRARAAKASKTKSRGSRSPEERQAERVAERRGKAQVRSVMRTRTREKERAGNTGSETTPPREHAPRVQKIRQGVVVSDRADKTITVRIDTARRHRRYEKIVRTSSTLHAHDEANDAHIGDTVIVREARPLSRTKRWRLIEVVKRAK